MEVCADALEMMGIVNAYERPVAPLIVPGSDDAADWDREVMPAYRSVLSLTGMAVTAAPPSAARRRPHCRRSAGPAASGYAPAAEPGQPDCSAAARDRRLIVPLLLLVTAGIVASLVAVRAIRATVAVVRPPP
jgi:hypothetical protein